MIRKLYRVVEDEDWTYFTDNIKHVDEDAVSTEVSISDVSAAELAEYLDDELENANHHSFVGANCYLLKTIEAATKDLSVAKQILWQIFQDGGLDEVAS